MQKSNEIEFYFDKPPIWVLERPNLFSSIVNLSCIWLWRLLHGLLLLFTLFFLLRFLKKVSLVIFWFQGADDVEKTHPELPLSVPPSMRLAPVVFFFFPPITSSVPHVSDELGSNISIPERNLKQYNKRSSLPPPRSLSSLPLQSPKWRKWKSKPPPGENLPKNHTNDEMRETVWK